MVSALLSLYNCDDQRLMLTRALEARLLWMAARENSSHAESSSASEDGAMLELGPRVTIDPNTTYNIIY